MKHILLMTLFVLFAGSASAAFLPTVDNTWEEINNDFYYRLKVGYPTINLDNGPLTSGNSVCFNGEELETTFKLEKCVDWRNAGRGERVCNEYVSYTGYAALNGFRTVCAEWRNLGRGERTCERYEDRAYTIPLNYSVPVYHKKRRGGGEYDYKLLFEKDFTIPNCQ